MHSSTFGVGPTQSHPDSPRHTHCPSQAPTPGTVFSHAGPGAAGLSSATPLQSSSTPLHASGAGSAAVHPTQPTSGSHVSNPRHLPTSFCTTHGRSIPANVTLQSHVPFFG